MGRKPCCSKNGVKKGAWTASEDKMLTDCITVHGEGKWRGIPKQSGLQRCGKSCRLRWLNYLRPDIKRGNISEDEDDLIIRLHRLLGNRWSLIAARLPGRTDNEIKNYWNTHLAKKPQLSLNSYLTPQEVTAIRDSPLPKLADTKLFSSPAAPSSTVRNHDMNLYHFQTCSAPVPWRNDNDCQQEFSYLDCEMGDISVSGEDFDYLFNKLDEVHTETETSIITETLQDLTDTLENWSAGYIENDSFETSASLTGSPAAIED